MSHVIIVLFNLKTEASVSAYEDWAKTTDLPIVRKLQSIDSFDLYKSLSVLGSDDTPPYEYVEVLTINDMEVFEKDTSTDTMKAVAGEFQAFADNPTFILTQNIG